MFISTPRPRLEAADRLSGGMVTLCLLLLLVPVRGEEPCPRLEYRGDAGCCKMCPAGSYVAQDCTSTRETQCRPCGDGEFTAADNGQLSCLRCQTCDPDEGLLELRACTRSSATTCGCAPGFACEAPTPDGSCTSCRRESECPVGQGVSSAGDESGVALCQPCAEGTFSSSPSRKPCQPWRRCGDQGLLTLRRGTAVSDAVCGSAGLQSSWILALVLGWALVCLLLLIIVCLASRRDTSSKRSKKCNLYQSFLNFNLGRDETSTNSNKLLTPII